MGAYELGSYSELGATKKPAPKPAAKAKKPAPKPAPKVTAKAPPKPKFVAAPAKAAVTVVAKATPKSPAKVVAKIPPKKPAPPLKAMVTKIAPVKAAPKPAPKPAARKPPAAPKKKKTSPLKKIGKAVSKAGKQTVKTVGKVTKQVANVPVVGGLVKGVVSSVPGAGLVQSVAAQAKASGIKFAKKKKKGGGTEVVGVNSAGAVVTAPLPDNLAENVEIEVATLLPENPVQQSATEQQKAAVALVAEEISAGVPPVTAANVAERAIEKVGNTVSSAAGIAAAAVSLLPPEMQEKMNVAERVVSAGERAKKAVQRFTKPARGVLDRFETAIDAADSAGEAVAAGTRAAVAAAGTGNAETGLFMAGLTSKPVLIAGGVGLLALLLTSRGRARR